MRALPKSVLVLLALLAGVVGLRLAALGFIRKTVPQWQFPAEHVEAMIRDIHSIEASPPFPLCGTTRDAAAVFDRILAAADGSSPLSDPPWWQHDEVHRALKANKSRWWEHVEEAPQGDLSITAELLAYDGWSGLLPTSRASLEREGGPGVIAFQFPRPNVMSLHTLAKLRILQGLRSREPLPALKEVRHLARLVSCGEQLIPQMVTTAILNVEARGYELAVEHGLLPAHAWSPVPAEQRKALKRVSFGLVAVYSGLAPEGTFQRVDALAGAVPGRCGALGEALEIATLQQAVLGEPYPFEVDHHQPIRDLDAALKTTPCSLPVPRAYWSHPEWTAEVMTEMAGSALLDPTRLPWVRDIAFYEVASATGSNFDLYESAGE